MIEPKDIFKAGKKMEQKNLKFRKYLKENAEEEVLDRQFLELHTELFSDYDCGRCRNCCKDYCASFTEEELEPTARSMGISKEMFVELYLRESHGQFESKNQPCSFLSEAGDCKIEGCRPIGCVQFPYTDQPGRIWSLRSTVTFTKTCPVAYEIVERLRELYKFS